MILSNAYKYAINRLRRCYESIMNNTAGDKNKLPLFSSAYPLLRKILEVENKGSLFLC